MRIFIISLATLFFFTACNQKKHAESMDPFYPPAPRLELVDEPEPQPVSPGSLFTEQSVTADYFSDNRAYRLNDIVLIRISESTSASSSATTGADKEYEGSFGIANFFGLELKNGGTRTDLNPSSLISATSDKEWEGTGTTQRAGSVRGSLAARVTRVFNNKHLMIQGYKTILVNGELDRVYLSGIVDPLMIAKDGSISTSQIADLQLRYGGRGIVTRQQKPGLFAQLLDVIWPF